jgi:5'-3' exonuclease
MRTVGGAETIRHILIDGNNILRRVYYAFVEAREKNGDPPIVDRKGTKIGIVYGFFSFLPSLLYDLASPTKISLFLDGKPTKRLEMDATYKVDDRKPLDVGEPIKLLDGREFPDQIEFIKFVMGHLGCDIYFDPNEEADDLIASFVGSNPGNVHMIVSSDKDFFQLIKDRVVVYRPGAPPPRLYDAERVEEYYEKKHGIRLKPSQVRIFKSLTGDPSDNITGVPRIRKKAVFPLCGCDSVDEIFESGLTTLSNTEHKNLVELKDRIKLNYELVGLKFDIDLQKCLIPSTGTDFDIATQACSELGINLDTTPFKIGKSAVKKVEFGPADWLLDI